MAQRGAMRVDDAATQRSAIPISKAQGPGSKSSDRTEWRPLEPGQPFPTVSVSVDCAASGCSVAFVSASNRQGLGEGHISQRNSIFRRTPGQVKCAQVESAHPRCY